MNFAAVLILFEFDNICGACISPFIRKYEDMLVIKGMNSNTIIFAQAAAVSTFFVVGIFFVLSYVYDPSHIVLMTLTNYGIAAIVWIILFLLYSYISIAINKRFAGFGFISGIGEVDSSSSDDEEEG